MSAKWCWRLAALAVPIVLYMELSAAAAPAPRPERILRQQSTRRGSAPKRLPSHGAERLTADEIRRLLASGADAPPADATCIGRAHLELWGGLVGNGADNEQPTADACCRSCREYEPHPDTADGAQCNTWVWHPATHECWLKHQGPQDLAASSRRAAEPAPAAGTPWVSGVWLGVRPCDACVVPSFFRGCISKTRCNTSRACGSPAIDGYSHVEPKCFEASPTARHIYINLSVYLSICIYLSMYSYMCVSIYKSIYLYRLIDR